MTALADKPAHESTGHAPVEQQLYSDGSRFDFFQAVALLEGSTRPSDRGRRGDHPPARFVTPTSTAFPASEVDSITPAEKHDQAPRVAVNFMGLTGPSGVLPQHYTELLIQLENRVRQSSKRTLRAWFDLFNNRLVGQFYRVWAKFRIDRGVAQRRAEQVESDAFTSSLYSLIGVGQSALRNRLSVQTPAGRGPQRQLVDRIPDLALVRHAGVLSRRQRSAAQIEAVLSDYFRVPVRIQPFHGQWLKLDTEDRTRIGRTGTTNQLGYDAMLGARVWDRQSRVRVCVGPLSREEFDQFLPDTEPGAQRRRFVSLCQLVRMLIGPDLDFDVQLILTREDVPRLRVQAADVSTRLSWNTWLASEPLRRDGDDPVFEPIESTAL